MANAEPVKLRIVAFKEGDAWAAQCLEYDIAAQAPDLDTLVRRMNAAIVVEAQHTLETRGQAFAGIDPAPDYFTAMFDSVHTSLCAQRPSDQTEADFRIAA